MDSKNTKNDLGADAAAVDSAGQAVPPPQLPHAGPAFTAGPWALHPRFPEWVIPASDCHKKIGGSVDPEQEAREYAKWICRPEYRPEHQEYHRSRVTLADEYEANCHLIASAPDLYHALKAIMAEPHGCRFCDYGKLRRPESGHDSWCQWQAAHAALAKAEGRTV